MFHCNKILAPRCNKLEKHSNMPQYFNYYLLHSWEFKEKDKWIYNRNNRRIWYLSICANNRNKEGKKCNSHPCYLICLFFSSLLSLAPLPPHKPNHTPCNPPWCGSSYWKLRGWAGPARAAAVPGQSLPDTRPTHTSLSASAECVSWWTETDQPQAQAQRKKIHTNKSLECIFAKLIGKKKRLLRSLYKKTKRFQKSFEY